MARLLPLALTLAAWPLVACDSTTTPPGDTDAGTGPTCELPAAATCTDARCQATTGTRAYAQGEVAAGAPAIAITWASSEVYAAADTRTVYYELSTPGALTGPRGPRTAPAIEMEPGLREILESPQHTAAIAFARFLRTITKKGPVERGSLLGTAITPVDLVPPGVKKQTSACTSADPTVCGDTMLCVIPEGTTAGTCAATINLKFYGRGPAATDVTANVLKVGRRGAIVIDQADAALLPQADAEELLRRFDEHIAPRNHQFFGEPLLNGRDRDQNGVVTFFFSKRVGQLQPNLVGYFFPDDMRPTQDIAHSNASDLLYLEPPGATVNLTALAGTIAHEYQHLINFNAKVLVNNSDQEEVWLDEGLSSFAEDIAGYGVDAFANVGQFMMVAGSTSLTGADSSETRGIAHLTVRYLFEQAGGAKLEPMGAGGGAGVAAVRGMVQTAMTGTDALLSGAGGRNLSRLMGDLMTTVAVDGSSNSELSCDPRFRLLGPEVDPYTNAQRGFHLRGMVPGRSGTITLPPPALSQLVDESLLSLNGGEIVEIPTAPMLRKFTVGAEVDNAIGLRILPRP